MQQNLIITNDGSHSISVPEINVTYHSIHGAIQESQYIFIDAGLTEVIRDREEIAVFEMGFGTGLNALLTLIAIENKPVKVYYETIDEFPLDTAIAASLNYLSELNKEYLFGEFMKFHSSSWNETANVTSSFSFRKRKEKLEEVKLDRLFHLVYFDAFAPSAQPGLWTTDVFRKLYNALFPGGLLLTYCSKGVVRRAMEEAGFKVTKLPGPKGKREIVRAEKKDVVVAPQFNLKR